MNTNVVNIDYLSPATQSKIIVESMAEHRISNSQDISSASWWEDRDNSTDSGFAEASVTEQSCCSSRQQSKGSSRGKESFQEPAKGNRASKPSRTCNKRPHSPERKNFKLYPTSTTAATTTTTSSSSPLDCCDYWLRFDSDEDNLERQFGTDRSGSIIQTPADFGQTASKVARTLDVVDSIAPLFSSPTEDFVDDISLDNIALDESNLFPMDGNDDFIKGNGQSVDVVPERLYSTPLSWEQPQAGVRQEPCFNFTPLFSNPEHQRLLAVAMGIGLPPSNAAPRRDTSAEARSPASTLDSVGSVPSPPATKSKCPTLKRSRSNQASPPLVAQEEKLRERPKDEKPKSSDRAAHNDIERKYRTNLKERIAELREAVPSLRTVSEDDDDDDTLMPVSHTASKVSKGTVLSKATEYIHHLERRNRNMAHKNEELKRRLQAFETLLGASPSPAYGQTSQNAFESSTFNTRGYT